MTSKRLSAAQRRAQLIDVGRSVFAQAPYDAVSVEEIARAAGVSKPIVYEHFGGKEGLYAVILDREMSALYSWIAEHIAEGAPRERFESAVLAFLAFARERPDGFAVLTRPGSRGMPEVMSALGDRVTAIFEEELQAAGYDPRPAPIYAHALIGMVTAAGQWWGEGQPISLEDTARHLAALGWMGLRHLPTEPTSLG